MKKDRMLAELLSEGPIKSVDSSSRPSSGVSLSSTSGGKLFEDSKVRRIDGELNIAKKERDEFFAARFDKVSSLINTCVTCRPTDLHVASN